MDRRLFSSFFVYLFILIDMGRRCLMLSGYWKVDPKYHWSNTTGGIVYSLTSRKISPSGCAAVCMYNSDCLMFGYSKVTGTCHGFRYLEHSPVSILEELEVIYKHTQCCHLRGYIWMEDGPLCVKIHSNRATWDNAKTQCEQDHGQLAIIDDVKKYQAFINNRGIGYPDNAWLGASDRETEGSWVWLNGADVNTSYWAYVQFNDYSSGYRPDKFNADCAVIKPNGGIIDINCLDPQQFICQSIEFL